MIVLIRGRRCFEGSESDFFFMSMVQAFKVVVVGDSGVGKTSLLTRFAKHEFRGPDATRSTISAAFFTRSIDVDGESVPPVSTQPNRGGHFVEVYKIQ